MKYDLHFHSIVNMKVWFALWLVYMHLPLDRGSWDIALCSWAGHFTLTAPLSTQVYKLVSVN